MLKSFLNLCCLLLFVQGFSQTQAQPAISKYSYYHPSKDKQSWQDLNLWLVSSYLTATTGQSPDSNIIYAGRTIGLSRISIIGAGIENPELLAQSRWIDNRNPGEGVRLLSLANGKKHLEQLILLGSYYTSQINRDHKNRDSAKYFLNKAINESKTLNEKRLGRVALSLLDKVHAVLGDQKNGEASFSQLIKDCQAANDRETEARSYIYRGLHTSVSETTEVTQQVLFDVLEKRITYFSKGQELCHALKDTVNEIIALTNLGLSNLVLDRWKEGYTIFLKVLDLEKAIGFPYTHYTTDLIAMITSTQGKFGEPLKYSLETVRTAEAVRDSISWATFYSRLSMIYLLDGERDEETLKWMYKALDRFILAKDANVYQGLYNIIALLNREGGREKEALDLALKVSKLVPPKNTSDSIFHHIAFTYGYQGVKQYKLAEKYGLAADSIRKIKRDYASSGTFEKSAIYTTLAPLYYAMGEYAKARKYMEMELADSSRTVMLLNDLQTYKQLIQIDSIFNDGRSAGKHFRQYMLLIDSNFRVSKLRQAEELEVLYQTKEKEDQISALHLQSKLEQDNLKQARLVRNLTMAGIIGLFVIAALLYRQSRLRKRNNKVVMNKNDQLQHLLVEKEWLLKEIHHRVKNNLQIVMSLLNSQSAFIDNAPALTAIHDSQHRVHAMSLIHQKLYGSDNVSSIDMSFYIRELATYLSDSFNTGQRIRFEYNIAPLEMDVSQAVPLGLILNEAITNSLKYAFPENRDGIIKISLSNTSPNHYLLRISDNGIGMPTQLTSKKGSLGMSLMAGLSEDLDGNLSIENNNGTTINISFVHDLSNRRPEMPTSSFVNSK